MEGMPPGLTRRFNPPDDYEAIYHCSVEPTEAVVVATEPGSSVSVSMLLGNYGADAEGCLGWETAYVCLGREAVTALVAQLQNWLDSTTAAPEIERRCVSCHLFKPRHQFPPPGWKRPGISQYVIPQETLEYTCFGCLGDGFMRRDA